MVVVLAGARHFVGCPGWRGKHSLGGSGEEDWRWRDGGVHLIVIISDGSDVADEGSYAAMVRSVSEMVGDQGLNLLINNAGVAPKSTRITQVKWQQMVDTFLVNSVAPVMLSKVLIAHMLRM
ncbi:hypothetical protein E2C01_027434 [Portunus trituberculatus]|uniref:Uncharacterized protein n=1 Tax=Portunus trituberculatus TaxID=210409 RepID=A0A5B7EHV7_PORTR|nr:hypothetical protein [Portunus trituberculatus]